MSQYMDCMDPDARSEAEARLRWLADLLGVDHLAYPWHGPDLADGIRRAIPAEDRRNSEAMRGALSALREMLRAACRRGGCRGM